MLSVRTSPVSPIFIAKPVRMTVVLMLSIGIAAGLSACGKESPGEEPHLRFTSINAGAAMTCAVTDKGIGKCWGLEEYEGVSTVKSDVPKEMAGFRSGVLALSPGGYYSWFSYSAFYPHLRPYDGFICGLFASKVARCTGHINIEAPDISSISAGSGHFCMINSIGAAFCAGQNFHGQLGNSSTDTTYTPILVSGLGAGVAQVSVSRSSLTNIKGQASFPPSLDGHSCALTVAGGVKCWGFGDLGQLGNGAVSDSTIPVDVVGLASGVDSIAVGGFFSCALASGQVWCWGEKYGFVPVPISSGIKAVSAGGDHACALTKIGGVKCWGSNYQGQLGGGILDTYTNTPLDVTGLQSDVVKISAGSYHSCALLTSGRAKCWGANIDGQLGNGKKSLGGEPLPVDVVMGD